MFYQNYLSRSGVTTGKYVKSLINEEELTDKNYHKIDSTNDGHASRIS